MSKWLCQGCRPRLSMLSAYPCPECCGFRRRPLPQVSDSLDESAASSTA